MRQQLQEILKDPVTDNLVAMKIINYDEFAEDNFIIEPGQSTNLENMENKRLKKCYIFLKYTVKRLGIPMKPYFLKKLVFNQQMVSYNESLRIDTDFENGRLLLAVLLYNKLIHTIHNKHRSKLQPL